jgi:hypothetical protein
MIDLAEIVVREHSTGSYSVKVWHGDRIVFQWWQYASAESAFGQGHEALLAFRKQQTHDALLAFRKVNASS